MNYIGHSAAVVAGGVLIVSYNEIEIYCLPKDIPDVIDVNLDQIVEIGQAIHAKDLKVSEGVQILAKGEEVIAHVEIARTHEVEEVTPVAAAAVPVEGAAAPAEGAAATAVPAGGKEAAPAGKPGAPAAKPGAPAAKAPEAKQAKKDK